MVKRKQLDKTRIENFFRSFDEELAAKNIQASYLILGGAALVMLEFIDRSTEDIDVVHDGGNFDLMEEAAGKYGIVIDRVTQCTTVDFEECSKEEIFSGKFLKIRSISPQDLLKSKIERFQKQDPADVNAILDNLKLKYADFKSLFSEMSLDYVGNLDRLKTNARIVVERRFAEMADDFYETFPCSYD